MADASPSPQVIALFAALVEQHAGLHYRLGERALFADKLVSHAEGLGFDSLLDYYYSLRYDDGDGAAMRALVESLLVHETYFFREVHPLQVAIDRHVAPIVRSGRRARIWSAACATGEEPLSIAMLLADRGLDGACDIVATDLSTAAIARPLTGRYRRRSLRRDGLDIAARWLIREGDEIVVPRRFVDAIQWGIANLCDPVAVASHGEFDLVVCRHVLIYFSEPTIASVVEHIGDRMHDGAGLLVGVSESLLRFSTRLVGEEVDGVFLYRRLQ
ncbi:MAG TPA: CheR family methyltransferase [Nannocystaceae bacterium]|nr:CheR family methyltransferase [Nannocystaceae bacterium]